MHGEGEEMALPRQKEKGPRLICLPSSMGPEQLAQNTSAPSLLRDTLNAHSASVHCHKCHGEGEASGVMLMICHALDSLGRLGPYILHSQSGFVQRPGAWPLPTPVPGHIYCLLSHWVSRT